MSTNTTNNKNKENTIKENMIKEETINSETTDFDSFYIQSVQKLLFRLGIRSTYQGFRYLCYGLTLCEKNEDYLLAVYKKLYLDIGKHYEVSRDSVEHCLRTVINACWDKGNRELLINIAGYKITQRPTNSEFIDILHHYLKTHPERPR